MQNLLDTDITTFFTIMDDVLGETWKKKMGRPPILAISEMVTIILWCTLIVNIKTLKGIYEFIKRYHRLEFPRLPDYSAFVRYVHRVSPVLLELLQMSMANGEALRFVDSTMLQVCKLVRASSHKVSKEISAFGKNHQGWHYGFKLHATVTSRGQFCSLVLTPANTYDAQVLPQLCNENTKIVVGDGTYNASVMRNNLWKEKKVFVLAPPHPKQNKKIMASWQHTLLKARSKIESVFGYIKQNLHLITSFPRSITGYLSHYLRVLLAYQFKTSR
jgi:hypothetical protein